MANVPNPLTSGRNSLSSAFPPRQRERHARHDRRYSPPVRSSSRTTQEGDRRFRGRVDLVGRRAGPAARGGTPARAGRDAGRAASGSGGIRSGRCTPCRRCCASACSRSPAATRTPTIATTCAPIRLFKLAVGRAPESGRDLCSQPTMSRLENAPSRVEVARMTAALVDVFCRSFPVPPAAITLDIDDTCDPVHGHQQLSLFNAFTTIRGASSPSTSTMWRAASRWRSSCAPARRPRGSRSARC